jgi:hypothetical protein
VKRGKTRTDTNKEGKVNHKDFQSYPLVRLRVLRGCGSQVDPRLGIYSPRLGIYSSRLGIYSPHPGIYSPHLSEFRSHPGILRFGVRA